MAYISCQNCGAPEGLYHSDNCPSYGRVQKPMEDWTLDDYRRAIRNLDKMNHPGGEPVKGTEKERSFRALQQQWANKITITKGNAPNYCKGCGYLPSYCKCNPSSVQRQSGPIAPDDEPDANPTPPYTGKRHNLRNRVPTLKPWEEPF